MLDIEEFIQFMREHHMTDDIGILDELTSFDVKVFVEEVFNIVIPEK